MNFDTERDLVTAVSACVPSPFSIGPAVFNGQTTSQSTFTIESLHRLFPHCTALQCYDFSVSIGIAGSNASAERFQMLRRLELLCWLRLLCYGSTS
jgi:hypothetical protein